ncbi:MAG: hypothetical protein M1423_06025 [Acidobacteria bacterium]|nr:hypothetical protein [Acidobacteriota bacterium]
MVGYAQCPWLTRAARADGTSLNVAKIRVSSNYAPAPRTTSLVDHVLPQTMPASQSHILVLEQQQKVGIAAPCVNLVRILHTKGDYCFQAQARPGLGSSPPFALIGCLGEKTLLKPTANGVLAYAKQLGYAVKGIALGNPHPAAHAKTG